MNSAKAYFGSKMGVGGRWIVPASYRSVWMFEGGRILKPAPAELADAAAEIRRRAPVHESRVKKLLEAKRSAAEVQAASHFTATEEAPAPQPSPELTPGAEVSSGGSSKPSKRKRRRG